MTVGKSESVVRVLFPNKVFNGRVYLAEFKQIFILTHYGRNDGDEVI
jgi:hypothetical protein